MGFTSKLQGNNSKTINNIRNLTVKMISTARSNYPAILKKIWLPILKLLPFFHQIFKILIFFILYYYPKTCNFTICSIFSKSSHVDWCTASPDTILKLDTIVMIQTKFGFQEVGVTGHDFESWPPKDHSSHVCFKLTFWFQRRRLLNIFPIGSYAKTMSADGGHLGWRSWSQDIIMFWLVETLKIFLSETTKPIELWLCRNDHWVVMY
jgi:hypothetical protein